jgi:putative protease
LLDRRPSNEYQNYITGHSIAHRSQFVGEVDGVQDGWAEVETKNRFSVGDLIEVIHPSGNVQMRLKQMRNADGQPVQVAAGNPMRVWIPLEERHAARYWRGYLRMHRWLKMPAPEKVEF